MIGASPLRKEDRRLLTGAGRYLDDLRREGMLHLGVLRSVEAHARIVKIEASRARALAGVVAVWSAADLPEITKPIGTASTGRPFAQPVLVPDVAR
jgi:carbon-monoxide dehydrogenase large subunit